MPWENDRKFIPGRKCKNQDKGAEECLDMSL